MGRRRLPPRRLASGTGRVDQAPCDQRGLAAVAPRRGQGLIGRDSACYSAERTQSRSGVGRVTRQAACSQPSMRTCPRARGNGLQTALIARRRSTRPVPDAKSVVAEVCDGHPATLQRSPTSQERASSRFPGATNWRRPIGIG